MLLNFDNLTIRNAVPSDAPQLLTWWNDGAVMAHAGFPNGLGTTQAEILRQMEAYRDDAMRVFILEADDRPVGEMSWHKGKDGTVEIGIKVCDVCHQNRGEGTLFLRMFITALFAQGVEQVTLDTNLKNTRAQHVYEKLGFEKVRVVPDAWKDQLGVPQTMVEYRLPRAGFIPLESMQMQLP